MQQMQVKLTSFVRYFLPLVISISLVLLQEFQIIPINPRGGVFYRSFSSLKSMGSTLILYYILIFLAIYFAFREFKYNSSSRCKTCEKMITANETECFQCKKIV